jgi:hypothetical protein
MPITSVQISGVLNAAARVFPSAVVSCSHTYTDGGSTRSQTFTAIRGALTAQQNINITGSATTESYILTVDIAALDIVKPAEGDRITVQYGDDAATSHTVIMRTVDPLRTMMVLTIGPKHG